jgi:ATP-binding cassette, subfamily C (CFTR/MRP), member 1
VLLDEAMSSVDVETEKLIDEVLAKEFEGCTVIYVAHRVETILEAEMVVVMEKGRIVEVGELSTLMKRRDRKLRNLVGGNGS